MKRIVLGTLGCACLAACHPRPSAKAPASGRETPVAVERKDPVELAAAPGPTAQLRVLETTDLHVNMEAFDYYKDAPTTNSGLVRTALLIRRARAEAANSVLVDNGDLIQGNPLGDYVVQDAARTDLHPVYKAMNLLGYAVANIGNHEFNYGLDFLTKTLAGADFPYVSANTFRDDGDEDPDNDVPLVKPYVIRDTAVTRDDGGTDTVKVGYIGFVPPQIMFWDRGNLLGKLKAADMVDMAQKYVPAMKRDGAEVIIAIPHSGISAAPRHGGDENAVTYLSEIPGIDAILCGHSHQVFPSATYAHIPRADVSRGLINGVPTVMAGQWGSHLGVVDLTLKKVDGEWHVLEGRAEAREVAKLLAPGDVASDIRAAVKKDHEATLAYLGEAVGRATTRIDSYFSQVRPSMAVQLLNDAQTWFAQDYIAKNRRELGALADLPLLSAAAPLKAGGWPDNYTDVPAGPLTRRNIADLYVYPNTFKVVKLTGAQVRDWLEMSAGMFNPIKPNVTAEQALFTRMPAYNFDVLSGVTYAIDLTQPPKFDGEGKPLNPQSQRIVDLRYAGQPVDPDQEFLVATNNYRASANKFPHLDGSRTVIDLTVENREILRDYAASHASVGDSLVENWRFLPVPGATQVTFTSAPAAKALVADTHGLVTYLGDEPTGFAKFRLDVDSGRTPSP